MNDRDYMNFSEDHELNYMLKKCGKRETQANRDILCEMGKELKAKLDKRVLKSDDFHEYVQKESKRLE